MRGTKLFTFLTLIASIAATAVYAESYIERMENKLEQKANRLNADLKVLGDSIGKVVKCGNDAFVSTGGSSCDYIEEKDANLADYVKVVPNCASDEFLVVAGKFDMACKHISQFDYLHDFDEISGAKCSGTHPRGKNYCRCGKWVTKSQYQSTRSC